MLKSEMVRNTSILISGTAVAQLIPIILQPVLRRIYIEPELFGAYSVYVSISGILLVLASLRYELAIVLPEKHSESINILFLTLAISFIFNLILVVFVILFKSDLTKFLNLPEKYSIYLYMVPLGTFLFSFYQSLNYWLVRKKRFMAISYNKFFRRGFEGASQVALRFTAGSHGLIIGDIIGHLANIVSGVYQSVKCGLSLRFLSMKRMKEALHKYSDYPKFNLVPSLMSACSYLLPAIIINRSFLSGNAGFYDLSKLFLSVPLALIATSLSNVLLQRITEKNNNNISILKDLLYILVFVSFVAVLEIIIISVWAEDIFSVFFGPAWKYSGSISRLLVWAFASNFIVSSLSSIYISLKQIKLLSLWQVIYFAGIMSLFYINFESFQSFLKLYVAIEVICCFLSIFFMVFIVSKYEKSILRNINCRDYR
jgi:O-antigen/teichoic acid export membrane protein